MHSFLYATCAPAHSFCKRASAFFAAGAAAGDSPVQSINSCLAMQHLSLYAHAVVLLDNQTLLDQLTAEASSSSGSSTASKVGSSAGSQGQQRAACKSAGAAGARCLTLDDRVALHSLCMPLHYKRASLLCVG
jgi:hypothetical protein